MSSPNTRYKLRKTYDRQLKNEVALKTKENVLRYLRFFNFIKNNIISLYDSTEDIILETEPDKFKFVPWDIYTEDMYNFWGETQEYSNIPSPTYEWGYQT